MGATLKLWFINGIEESESERESLSMHFIHPIESSRGSVGIDFIHPLSRIQVLLTKPNGTVLIELPNKKTFYSLWCIRVPCIDY